MMTAEEALEASGLAPLAREAGIDADTMMRYLNIANHLSAKSGPETPKIIAGMCTAHSVAREQYIQQTVDQCRAQNK